MSLLKNHVLYFYCLLFYSNISIAENQHQYIEKLQKEYEEDLRNLLEATGAEMKLISENSGIEQEHVKTILYRQQTEGTKYLKEQYESYMVKLCETGHEVSTIY